MRTSICFPALASVCVAVLCFAAAEGNSAALDQDSATVARPAPDAAAQQKILSAMRQYAAEYISNLPDFICQQTTYQFQAGRKSDHWHKGDTLTSTLTFTQGKEQRALKLVNDKPIKLGMKPWRTPLVTTGEFGILLSNVFGEASAASFQWSGWHAIDNKTLAVFDFSIDQQHSTLKLSKSDLAQAIVPYHGSVYGDPESGVIWRITDAVSDVPADLDTRSIATSIDYGPVQIGQRQYMLPTRASVLLEMRDKKVRNDMTFTDYRKFESQSTITFGDSSQGTQPPHE